MSKISVVGRGTIHVVPDVTRIEVTVSAVFDTYDEAYKKAREGSSWMVKILEYNNLSGNLCKTVKLDISDHLVSEYDENDNYIGQLKEGYDLNMKMKIDIGIDNVMVNNLVRGIGKFISGAQINIGYTVMDPRPTQLKMLERAVKDATEKAEIMANAAGCQLGSVSEIEYERQSIHVYSQARNIHSNDEAKASTADSLDITPEDLAFSDYVNVSWELKPIESTTNN
ncbi:MAG: SIMPL domain-containing protein [Bacteroidaceae bacterium]|jgi:hypothetical protein|nr:SIMPL domain-containing protein [Bacteroidaceae bacterium]